mgnify:CR=1 FL=1
MRSRFDRELDTLNVDLQKMSGLVENALENTIAAFKNKNTKLAKEVMENDRMINDMERSIESICLVNVKTAASGKRFTYCDYCIKDCH